MHQFPTILFHVLATKFENENVPWVLFWFMSTLHLPASMFKLLFSLSWFLGFAEAFAPSLGLYLVGPYDVLAGKTQKSIPANDEQPNYLLHWRYYYDVPEFMTVIRGDDETQFHIGYFRYFVLHSLSMKHIFYSMCFWVFKRIGFILSFEKFE